MKTKTVKKHTHSLTNTCITFAQKMRNKDTKQTNSKKKQQRKKHRRMNVQSKYALKSAHTNLKTFDDI